MMSVTCPKPHTYLIGWDETLKEGSGWGSGIHATSSTPAGSLFLWFGFVSPVAFLEQNWQQSLLAAPSPSADQLASLTCYTPHPSTLCSWSLDQDHVLFILRFNSRK